VVSANNDVDQALFQSVSDDGTRWLFVCTTGDRWAIKRNGRKVAVGTGDRPSVQAGLAKFMSFATRPPSAAGACDPVVLEQLNRIEEKKRRSAHGGILIGATQTGGSSVTTAATSPQTRRSRP